MHLVVAVLWGEAEKTAQDGAVEVLVTYQFDHGATLSPGHGS